MAQDNKIVTSLTKEHRDPSLLVASALIIILYLTFPSRSIVMSPLTLSLGVAGLVFPRFRMTFGYWLLFSAIVLTQSTSAVNINMIWIFPVVLVAFLANNTGEVLRSSARWFIGFAFLLTAFWKWHLSSFFDFIESSRFIDVDISHLFYIMNFMNDSVIADNGKIYNDVFYGTSNSGVFADPGGHICFIILIIATLIVETSVAIAYLSPLKKRTWLRDVVLITFLFGAYVVVPVAYFARFWCIMGFLASDLPVEKKTKIYGSLFALTFLLGAFHLNLISNIVNMF